MASTSDAQPPVSPADLAVGRHVTRGDHGVSDAELPERPHGVRRQQQREAELPGSGGTLEHAHEPPGTVQRDRRSEPADPGADNESRAPHVQGPTGAIDKPVTLPSRSKPTETSPAPFANSEATIPV